MWDGARVTDGKKLTFPHLLLPVLSFLRAAYPDTRDDFPGETIWGNPAVPGPLKILTFTDDTLNNRRLIKGLIIVLTSCCIFCRLLVKV